MMSFFRVSRCLRGLAASGRRRRGPLGRRRRLAGEHADALGGEGRRRGSPLQRREQARVAGTSRSSRSGLHRACQRHTSRAARSAGVARERCSSGRWLGVAREESTPLHEHFGTRRRHARGAGEIREKHRRSGSCRLPRAGGAWPLSSAQRWRDEPCARAPSRGSASLPGSSVRCSLVSDPDRSDAGLGAPKLAAWTCGAGPAQTIVSARRARAAKPAGARVASRRRRSRGPLRWARCQACRQKRSSSARHAARR